jgi:hypothetical protein
LLPIKVTTLSLPVGATTQLLLSSLVIVCWLFMSKGLSLQSVSVAETTGSSFELKRFRTLA